MMKVNLKRKSRNTEKLKDKIRKLSKKKVRSGYFSGGIHSTSNLSYAEMMNIHEVGMHGNVPRPVRSKTLLQLKSLHMKDIKRDIDKYFYSGGDMEDLLSGIGVTITTQAQEVFGNSRWLTVTANPTPLIDTGELKMNWTWDIVLD